MQQKTYLWLKRFALIFCAVTGLFCVIVADPNDQANAPIIGKAEIVTDAQLRKNFWQEPFGFFFPSGPSDPDYCLLKIIPKKVEYLNPGPSFHHNRTRVIIKL